MYTITLHNTETEEIVGLVAPVKEMDFDKFYDVIMESFVKFHKEPNFDGDYSIDDFVDFHNENHPVQIDWVINDFIQLS